MSDIFVKPFPTRVKPSGYLRVNPGDEVVFLGIDGNRHRKTFIISRLYAATIQAPDLWLLIGNADSAGRNQRLFAAVQAQTSIGFETSDDIVVTNPSKVGGAYIDVMVCELFFDDSSLPFAHRTPPKR